MPALVALDPGLEASVQDLGRPGHAALGVARAGAADPLSLAVANRLVGNPDGAPALELTLTGGRWRAEGDVTLALAGARMSVHLEEPSGVRHEAGWHAALRLPAGWTLALGSAAWGARAYLAVAGGLDAPLTLGSASAHRATGLGGDPVVRGLRLVVADGARRATRALSREAGAEIEAWLRAPTLRATDGAHAERFAAAERGRFWAGELRASAACDRMGLRLEGPAVAPPGAGRMTTEGMAVGAVQIPAAGQAIALLVDAPTTGGYPVVACVAAVDLPRLGQVRPHERLRLERVALAHARAAYAERGRRLDALLEPAGPPEQA